MKKGFILLETIVSLFVLGITISALLELQKIIININHEAYMRNEAINIACNILEGGNYSDKRFKVQKNNGKLIISWTKGSVEYFLKE